MLNNPDSVILKPRNHARSDEVSNFQQQRILDLDQDI